MPYHVGPTIGDVTEIYYIPPIGEAALYAPEGWIHENDRPSLWHEMREAWLRDLLSVATGDDWA